MAKDDDGTMTQAEFEELVRDCTDEELERFSALLETKPGRNYGCRFCPFKASTAGSAADSLRSLGVHALQEHPDVREEIDEARELAGEPPLDWEYGLEKAKQEVQIH